MNESTFFRLGSEILIALIKSNTEQNCWITPSSLTLKPRKKRSVLPIWQLFQSLIVHWSLLLISRKNVLDERGFFHFCRKLFFVLLWRIEWRLWERGATAPPLITTLKYLSKENQSQNHFGYSFSFETGKVRLLETQSLMAWCCQTSCTTCRGLVKATHES